jgi:hypothetical protein
MASIRKEIATSAGADDVWAALHDLGALHTRLVPGFVVDTQMESGARTVTFANGMTVREVIVDVSEDLRRVVWSASGGLLTHHNRSAQVVRGENGETKVVWIADFLPDEAYGTIDRMMEQGMSAMKTALDKLGGSESAMAGSSS